MKQIRTHLIISNPDGDNFVDYFLWLKSMKMPIENTFSSISDALHYSPLSQPDLVVMHLNKASSTRLEQYQKLRAFYPNAKIVGVSTYFDPTFEELMKGIDADGYFAERPQKLNLLNLRMHSIVFGDTKHFKVKRKKTPKLLLTRPLANGSVTNP